MTNKHIQIRINNVSVDLTRSKFTYTVYVDWAAVGTLERFTAPSQKLRFIPTSNRYTLAQYRDMKAAVQAFGKTFFAQNVQIL